MRKSSDLLGAIWPYTDIVPGHTHLRQIVGRHVGITIGRHALRRTIAMRQHRHGAHWHEVLLSRASWRLIRWRRWPRRTRWTRWCWSPRATRSCLACPGGGAPRPSHGGGDGRAHARGGAGNQTYDLERLPRAGRRQARHHEPRGWTGQRACCPGCGPCAGMFTANTMGRLGGVGDGPAGRGATPTSARVAATRSPVCVMDLLTRGSARDILTPTPSTTLHHRHGHGRLHQLGAAPLAIAHRRCPST